MKPHCFGSSWAPLRPSSRTKTAVSCNALNMPFWTHLHPARSVAKFFYPSFLRGLALPRRARISPHSCLRLPLSSLFAAAVVALLGNPRAIKTRNKGRMQAIPFCNTNTPAHRVPQALYWQAQPLYHSIEASLRSCSKAINHGAIFRREIFNFGGLIFYPCSHTEKASQEMEIKGNVERRT